MSTHLEHRFQGVDFSCPLKSMVIKPSGAQPKPPRSSLGTKLKMKIDTDNYDGRYSNHLKQTAELCQRHKDYSDAISVLLRHHPETGERTEPLAVLLDEIFRANAKEVVPIKEKELKEAKSKKQEQKH